jgi:hypothetical protein
VGGGAGACCLAAMPPRELTWAHTHTVQLSFALLQPQPDRVPVVAIWHAVEWHHQFCSAYGWWAGSRRKWDVLTCANAKPWVWAGVWAGRCWWPRWPHCRTGTRWTALLPTTTKWRWWGTRMSSTTTCRCRTCGNTSAFLRVAARARVNLASKRPVPPHYTGAHLVWPVVQRVAGVAVQLRLWAAVASRRQDYLRGKEGGGGGHSGGGCVLLEHVLACSYGLARVCSCACVRVRTWGGGAGACGILSRVPGCQLQSRPTSRPPPPPPPPPRPLSPPLRVQLLGQSHAHGAVAVGKPQRRVHAVDP